MSLHIRKKRSTPAIAGVRIELIRMRLVDHLQNLRYPIGCGVFQLFKFWWWNQSFGFFKNSHLSVQRLGQVCAFHSSGWRPFPGTWVPFNLQKLSILSVKETNTSISCMSLKGFVQLRLDESSNMSAIYWCDGRYHFFSLYIILYLQACVRIWEPRLWRYFFPTAIEREYEIAWTCIATSLVEVPKLGYLRYHI